MKRGNGSGVNEGRSGNAGTNRSETNSCEHRTSAHTSVSMPSFKPREGRITIRQCVWYRKTKTKLVRRVSRSKSRECHTNTAREKMFTILTRENAYPGARE